MNIDATNGDTAVVNYQQSASDITDLNIGQATTDYTRQQIFTSVGTEVLSQMQSDGKSMTDRSSKPRSRARNRPPGLT